jgi:hypothetical protein
MAANPHKLTVGQIHGAGAGATSGESSAQGVPSGADGGSSPCSGGDEARREGVREQFHGSVRHDGTFSHREGGDVKARPVGSLRAGWCASWVRRNRIDPKGIIQGLRTRRRGKQVRKGVYSVKGRDLKNIGPIARKARLDPSKGRIQRRTPTRYLHLIELGGKTRKIRAGHFMDQAARSSANTSMQAFNRVLFAGMSREFNRMAAK